MTITIIGWYGTETIGDRAILAGIISLLNKAYDRFEIRLGSLYPFFSDRTLNEDYSLYKEITGKGIKIEVFNTKDSKALIQAIKHSDLLVMGGGPLMDIDALFMVEYAFKKAKRFGVKTALLGCGVGPLFHKKYRKSVLNIFMNSDLIILRDARSKENIEEIYHEFNKDFEDNNLYISYDPAVECALEFNKYNAKEIKEYIAVNLREFPKEYAKEECTMDINNELINFIETLSNKYMHREIRLVPMHYFHIGDDDRKFLNMIALKLEKENIKVQNTPLTLKETMYLYQNAYFNIGMRFHSTVLQTVLSGKNYILDYTEPNKGKIFGFISDIDQIDFFKERHILLQQEKISIDMITGEEKVFSLSEIDVSEKLNIYISTLRDMVK